MTGIDRVGVVGCGLMGAGIAEVCARAAKDVVIVEANRSTIDTGLRRLDASLHRAEARGKIPSSAAVMERIQVRDDLDALHDRALVIEAIKEAEGAKIEMFRRLDHIVTKPDAILASNTSSIPIMKLAVATSRPAQVLGVHFLNPVPVLTLVELVPSLLTDPITTERARASVEDDLGKHAIDS
jgi:3-hydroxybutyryl-CoA dehydrogenase